MSKPKPRAARMRKPSRSIVNNMPPPIPDTPENVERVVLNIHLQARSRW